MQGLEKNRGVVLEEAVRHADLKDLVHHRSQVLDIIVRAIRAEYNEVIENSPCWNSREAANRAASRLASGQRC